MAVVLRVIPTKSFLMMLKAQVALLKTAHKLLQRKRDELVKHVRELIEQLRHIRRRVAAAFLSELERLAAVRGSLGLDLVDSAARLMRGQLDIKVLEISVMGVLVPRLKIMKRPTIKDRCPLFVRNLVLRANKLLGALFELFEIEASLEHLIADLERTNRIVNALEKIIIPRTLELLKYVADRIEEEELEEFIRLKLVRNILQARRGT